MAKWQTFQLPKLEMWLQSPGWDDPLKKEMETRSSILAWEIPRTDEPDWLQSMRLQKVRHDLATEHTGIATLLKKIYERHLYITWKSVGSLQDFSGE